MKKPAILLCLVWFIGLQPIYGQASGTGINPEYIKLDLTGVPYFARMGPIENYSVPSLKKRFNAIPAYATWADETNLGFGAKRLKLSKGLGTVTIYIDLLIFQNRIAFYEIAINPGASAWPREAILQAWTKNSGPPLTENDGKLRLAKDFGGVWTDYKTKVAIALGPMRSVNVPGGLRKSYDLLTNPLENSRISFVACDDGKEAIDALEGGKRVDLIQNVLRGYNPGGRIYAAISLLRMNRRGVKLSPSTRAAIRKVVELDAEAGTCWGHTGVNGLSARDIVPEYVKSDKWD